MTDFRDTQEWRLENLKGTILLASQTIKSLEIINGGAAIGILTFYGHISSERGTTGLNKCAIIVALVCFGLGVFSAVACSFSAYIAQRIVATNSRGEMAWFHTAVAPWNSKRTIFSWRSNCIWNFIQIIRTSAASQERRGERPSSIWSGARLNDRAVLVKTPQNCKYHFAHCGLERSIIGWVALSEHDNDDDLRRGHRNRVCLP